MLTSSFYLVNNSQQLMRNIRNRVSIKIINYLQFKKPFAFPRTVDGFKTDSEAELIVLTASSRFSSRNSSDSFSFSSTVLLTYKINYIMWQVHCWNNLNVTRAIFHQKVDHHEKFFQNQNFFLDNEEIIYNF